jgi:uncharacterized protein (DUF433 family)
MHSLDGVIHSDPEILHGVAVFSGTRVPVRSLFEYIEAGDTIDEFLAQFPSVTRGQVSAVLDSAMESVVANATTF